VGTTGRGEARPASASLPNVERIDGYGATILLGFIVDTTGHAEPSTVHELWPKDKPRPTGRDLEAYKSFLEEASDNPSSFRAAAA
jgi:hypothetical protein